MPDYNISIAATLIFVLSAGLPAEAFHTHQDARPARNGTSTPDDTSARDKRGVRDDTLLIRALPDTVADELFEGTLYYEMNINGMHQEFRYFIKRGLVRLEIDDPHMGGSMTLLISPDELRMVVIIDEIHAYADLQFEDIANRGESLVDQMMEASASGKRTMIAGVENEEFLLITEAGNEIRFWSPVDSKRYGHFHFPDFGNRLLARILNYDVPSGFFPFALSYEDENNSIEITLVEIHDEIPDLDLFAVPATYRNITLTIPDY